MSRVCRRLDPPGGDPVVRAVLDSRRPAIQLRSWQGGDEVAAVARIGQDGTYALLASFVHDEVVRARGTSAGPVEHLVDEVMRLIPVPPSGTGRHYAPESMPFDDLLLLHRLRREGEDGLLATAVAGLGLDTTPGWVEDLATSTAGATLGVHHADGTAAGILWAAATPSGWLRLDATTDARITPTRLTHNGFRNHVLDLATLALQACPP